MMSLLGANGCGSGGPTESRSQATVISLTIDGARSITTGGSSQLIAVARLSDGRTRSVGSSAAWQSSDPGIATVSGAGLVGAVAVGTVTITATYRGRSDHVTVTVIPAAPAVTALTITGIQTITVGQTTQLVLTATLTDGTTRDATTLAIWQSTRPTFATVSGTGLVAALSPGTAVITAAYGNQATSISIVVTALSPDRDGGTTVGRHAPPQLSTGARPSP